MKKINKAIKLINNLNNTLYSKSIIEERKDMILFSKESNHIGYFLSFSELLSNKISLFLDNKIKGINCNNDAFEISYFSYEIIKILPVFLSIDDDSRLYPLSGFLSKLIAFNSFSGNISNSKEIISIVSNLMKSNKIAYIEEYRALYLIYQISRKLHGIDNYFPKEVSININEEIYSDVINNWDTKNTDFLNSLLRRMAEEHLHQSHFKKEYQSEDFWVYPYEILSFLSIRKMAGFKDTISTTHPLLLLEWINPFPETIENIFKDDLVDCAYKKFLEISKY